MTTKTKLVLELLLEEKKRELESKLNEGWVKSSKILVESYNRELEQTKIAIREVNNLEAMRIYKDAFCTIANESIF